MPAVKQMGSDIFLLLEDVAIECTTSVGMDFTVGEIDVSCKNTNGDSDVIPGQKTRTYSVEGILTDGTTTNKDFKALEAYAEAGTTITALIGGVDVGDTAWEQEAIITNLSMQSGGNDSPATWSASLKGKGSRTVVTVS